jgi:adenine deaminase
MFHVEHIFKNYIMKISGKLFDIHLRDIYPAEIIFSNGHIESINRVDKCPDVFILPGLIDAHIHIESSMVTPGAFGFEAVRHGTTAVVSDPHEIANVLGTDGVLYMIRDSMKSPVRFWFGAPSCVPATAFETNGAAVTSEDVEKLLMRPEIKYLSEMMNFPGVIYSDKEVLKKIEAARRLGKPIDGHAPGLTGSDLEKYINAGISTDHECSTIDEAKEKIALGMKVLIREGSAARNLDSLKDLFRYAPDMLMLCSDDLHPEMLVKGHINILIARLIRDGLNAFDVVRSATINPVNHYNLDSGLLKAGDKADFIITGNLESMIILETWIGGEKVYGEGKRSFTYMPGEPVNNFRCSCLREKDIRVINQKGRMRVIGALEGELLTRELKLDTPEGPVVSSDINRDILKLVVKERYHDAPAAIGFINGFGLKSGAFACSIAHDSHNIVCAGTNDRDIVAAINEIVRMKGGLAVANNGTVRSLQLDIGGIMTTRSCADVAVEYDQLNKTVKTLGCKMAAPFMTLSFMALLVIPELKMGDRGLFDVNKFKPVSLFLEP